MPKAKTTKKKSSTKAKARTAVYRPSNLTVFVIVLLLVALGTVSWLFVSLATSAKV